MRNLFSFVVAATIFAGAAQAATLPSTVADLGAIDGTTQTYNGTLANGRVVDWISFELGSGATYLDIDTNGSYDLQRVDTEIGLYRADGTLVANDDDFGLFLDSMLSFGTGSGLAATNNNRSGFGTGEDGAVPFAGTYYLAVSRYNTRYADDFGAITSSFFGGDYTVTIRSDDVQVVPLPASLPLAMVGLIGIGLVARRKL